MTDKPNPIPEPQEEEPVRMIAPPIEPVQPGHFVFIGKAHPLESLDCDKFEGPDAPHRRPPRPLHDATDYPQRHSVMIDIIEIVQGPASNLMAERKPPQAIVAFALGTGAFRAADHNVTAAAYDKAYCKRLNGWLNANYLVVHAYGVHVDRGNSFVGPGAQWQSMGTDPGKGNAGFETLEQARTFANSLLTTDESIDH